MILLSYPTACVLGLQVCITMPILWTAFSPHSLRNLKLWAQPSFVVGTVWGILVRKEMDGSAHVHYIIGGKRRLKKRLKNKKLVLTLHLKELCWLSPFTNPKGPSGQWRRDVPLLSVSISCLLCPSAQITGTGVMWGTSQQMWRVWCWWGCLCGGCWCTESFLVSAFTPVGLVHLSAPGAPFSLHSTQRGMESVIIYCQQFRADRIWTQVFEQFGIWLELWCFVLRETYCCLHVS
jgi:hypothetical protein